MVDLMFLPSWPHTRRGTSNPKPHQNHNLASVPLIPKLASDDAAMSRELRNRDTSCAPRRLQSENANCRRHLHAARVPLAPNRRVTTVENGKAMTAEAFLARLAERGVDYVFANAGTDFAPIIEALSRKNGKYPRFVTVPHENLAMAMANGYYRMAGKPAAVMVHVTVGTANTICGLMNMARDNVPVHAVRRPHADHRNRPPGFAQRCNPLGPGSIRSGRHGARVREMGLRAARRPAAGRAGRSRTRHRDVRAARTGLHVPAARGAGERGERHAARQRAPARG